VLVFAVAPLAAAEPTAQLGAVSGTVAVTHANGSAVQPAGAGASLGPGDRIATVGKASAIVELPGIGRIELGAETTILLHELRTEGGATIVTIEVVRGTTVHRLTPGSDTRLVFRVVDPTGEAVARANGAAIFGYGRDENGSVTVACERCPNGALTFPGDRDPLTSGIARTLTARGDLIDRGLGGSIYDALAAGATAGEDGGDTPAGNRLPAGQRTGSRDARHTHDEKDQPSNTQPAPNVGARIASPSAGETVTGPTLTVRWETVGYTIVPAAQARRPDEVHVHIFLDRDPAPILASGQPIPLNDPNIVHTANPIVTFQNVVNGPHRLWLVLATGDHVPLRPPVTDTVAFTLAGSSATPTPTLVPTPTPTPGAVIHQEATIANFIYLPDPITIRVGQTVRWTNLDNAQDGHTVTAQDRSWTSPVLGQNGAFVRTFTQVGTFLYFCEPHPQMTAFIDVQP